MMSEFKEAKHKRVVGREQQTFFIQEILTYFSDYLISEHEPTVPPSQTRSREAD